MGYTIGEVAKMTGLSTYALRYYDKEGLLFFVERSSGGQRIFKDSDLDWINEITILKNAGVPIKQIKSYMDWYRDGDPHFEKRLNLFHEQKKGVIKKIEQLQEYLEMLNFKIWYYEKQQKEGNYEWHRPGTCLKLMEEYKKEMEEQEHK